MPEVVGSNNAVIEDLRQHLKQWERDFADKNGGRKPTQDDARRDATIAAKYKEFNATRVPSKQHETPRKAKQTYQLHEPREVLKERPANVVAATPKRTTKTLKIQEVEEEELTPAHVRLALGPTPQKDGEILGIFDIVTAATPTRGNNVSFTEHERLVGATPSKSLAPASTDLAVSRTPQSSGKRFYLGAFAGTPLKRKREDDGFTPSTAKRQFATPSFLRRIMPLPRVEEESNEPDVALQPFKKRGLVRSLSTIIKDLRKQEEQRMDDEWDILQELEAEEAGETVSTGAPKVLVEDSQAVEMPLGPDQGADSSEEDVLDPGALDANGNPRKVWKKKGLKRQTKRTKMRPVLHKPKKAADLETPESDDEGEKVVEETQLEGVEKKKSSDAEPKEKAKKGKKVQANFRKLKIKNKNSKAGGRKFGRR